MGDKSRQPDFLIVVSGLPNGTFDTKSGGQPSANTSTYYNGGDREPEVYADQKVYSDMVVGRGYERDRDQAMLLDLDGRIGEFAPIITVTPLDKAGTPSGPPKRYKGLLKGLSDPDADSNGTAIAKCELRFGIKGLVK